MSTRDVFAAASGASVFISDGIQSEEHERIQTMRVRLGDRLDGSLPEIASDWSFVRFLRGYGQDVERSISAFGAMLDYRAGSGVDAIRSELLELGMPWPHTMAKFAGIAELMGRGITHLHTNDREGNILCHVLVVEYCNGLKSVLQRGQAEQFKMLNQYIDEWLSLKLHELSAASGRMVGQRILIDVKGIGLTTLNKSILDLLKEVGQCWTHYPERVARIDDINNTRIALMSWPIIKPFIPKHTRDKLQVYGTDYQAGLLRHIDAQQLPPSMGGLSTAASWHYMSGDSDSSSMLTVVAGATSTVGVSVETGEGSKSLAWEVSVKDNDITVSLTFTTSSDTPSDIVQKPCRVKAGNPMIGTYVCTQDGELEFVFDNSHSWMTSKQVAYGVS